MLFVVVCGLFSKLKFSKLFREHYSIRLRVSCSLNPDQDPQSVGPDQVPNYLQRLSAEDIQKAPLARKGLILFVCLFV